LDVLIVLSEAKGDFDVKKVEAPSKKPQEMADYVYFPTKNIKFQTFKIGGTLVFLCTSEQGLHLRTPNPGLTRGSPPPFVM
jgi:hypothetical protein